MSAYDKRRIFRVYTYGKSYILSSQLIESEKLQIKAVDSTVSLNKLSADEWNSMTNSKTNSVKSPSFGMAFDAYGCLGLLSISTQQLQQQQSPQQSQSQFHNNSPPKEDTATMLHYLIFVKEVISVGTIKKFDIMRISDVTVLPLNSDINSNPYNPQLNYLSQTYMNYINEIKKFLSSGVFYFAYSPEANSYFDLTLSSQARYQGHHSNKKFLWNFNLHLPFRRFNVDTNQWLLKIICGCIEIKKIVTTSKVFKACIFSRLSCDRVGTRFNCRGVNDEGNCANFVETEQVIYSTETDEESSFLQLRGSVPVFFEQSGIQVGSHKIKISRSTHACYPAFERHIKSLIQDYGSSIFVLNLLGIKGDESILTNFFYYLCQISPYSMKLQLNYTNFDYHQELKINKQALGEKLWPHLTQVFYRDNHTNNSTDGMFFSLKSSSNQGFDNDSGFDSESAIQNFTAKLQHKFIRTNCMDCLDRTNSVQAFVGIEMLRYQLAGFVSESEINKFREVFRQMWIINGDCISKIYAGTGAIQGKSVTQDISRSLSRAIQNNFLDYTKQDAIETFLYSMSRNYGELADRVKVLMSQTFLRLPYSILREVVSAKKQYTQKTKCKLVMGTWNINGGLNKFDMDELDLNDWLIDGPIAAKKTGFGYLDPSVQPSSLIDADIFAIGFEEIVDLNAQNIVSASDENATIWYNKIIECLRKYGDYVQLIAENLQLVGVCLFVFVLKKHVGYIRDVCISKTKTGFGGAAGNKGGVLLRFIYYNTSMCFVCSHFAAHQKEIRQRNEDFRQIYETSEFQGQAVTTTSKIETKFHDYVFWCGDLNYRIDLANDYCRTLIAQRDWDTLLRAEQLCIQKNEQNVFREFEEAPILFPPTYKYNLNEDTYDRSEKCRVPAWTDRILWRSRLHNKKHDHEKKAKCLYYGRADIRYSDHRPVTAVLEVDVDKVIPQKLIEVLNRAFTTSHGSFQVVLIATTHTNEMNEMIAKDIVDLFRQFRSFVTYREFRNYVYLTFSDGKFAYEAYAQLNNYHLEKYDLTLLVRVENEQSYQKLIEQELMDCLVSLNYVSDSIHRMSVDIDKEEVKVADLLGSDFGPEDDVIPNEDGTFVSYINLPTKIHSSTSITNDMRNLRTQDLDEVQDKYHNPLVKALSNSNLNMFDSQSNQHNHSKYIHSAVNLLDVANEELIVTTAPMLVPPKRPPPPTSIPRPNTDPFNTSPFDDPVPTIQVTKDSAASLSFGFDDDFSKFNPRSNSNSNNQESLPPPAVSTIIPTRAPPLPPLPNNTTTEQTKVTTPPNNPTFTLFDDPFDSFDSFGAATLQPATSTITSGSNPPPLPASKPATVPSRPPPLPPLPTTQPLIPISNQPKIPQRPTPPPPPVPPLPSSKPLMNSDNSNQINNNINKATIKNDLDLLGDPGDLPLPPPIKNYFS